MDTLFGNAVDRASGIEHEGFVESANLGVVAIIRLLVEVDGPMPRMNDANLPSQGEVDGRRAVTRRGN